MFNDIEHEGGDVATPTVVVSAIADMKELAEIEVALAKDELRREVLAVRRSLIMLSGALGLLSIGVTLLVVAFITATFESPASVAAAGLIAVVAASAIGWFGVSRWPPSFLGETEKRIEDDLRLLKERLV